MLTMQAEMIGYGVMDRTLMYEAASRRSCMIDLYGYSMMNDNYI